MLKHLLPRVQELGAQPPRRATPSRPPLRVSDLCPESLELRAQSLWSCLAFRDSSRSMSRSSRIAAALPRVATFVSGGPPVQRFLRTRVVVSGGCKKL